MAEAKKYPTPVTNPETAQFWEAAKAGKFMIKRCTACGEPHYFPRSICPFCFSDKTVWEESSGEATIYTYSLMRKSPTGPYAIAYVTLKEGPSLQTNIVDCDLDEPEDRPEGEGGVEANRRRPAAVLHGGLIGFSPRARPSNDEWSIRRESGDPVNAGDYWMPSPTGGA